MEKILKTRIQHKIDTTANWATAGKNGFVPLKGEIIFYSDRQGIYKVGDGTTNINQLKFATYTRDQLDKNFNKLLYKHEAYPDLQTAPVNASYLKVTVKSSGEQSNMLYKIYVYDYWLAAEVEVSTDSLHRSSSSFPYHNATVLVDNGAKLMKQGNFIEGECSFYFDIAGSTISYNGCMVYVSDESGMGQGEKSEVDSIEVELVTELPSKDIFDKIFTVVDRAEYEDVATKADIDQVWNDAMASFNYATGDGYQASWGDDTYITVTTDVNGLATVKPTENTMKAIDSSIIPIFDCVNENNMSPSVWLYIPSLLDHGEFNSAIARREFYVADSSVACSHRLDVYLMNAPSFSSFVINKNGVDSSISIVNGYHNRISIKGQDYYNSWLLHFDVRIIKNKLYINVEEI